MNDHINQHVHEREEDSVNLRGLVKTGCMGGGSMILTEAAGGASMFTINGLRTTCAPT